MAISYRDLTRAERKCLTALYMPEALADMPGVGMPSIKRLLTLGLIEEAEAPLGADYVKYRRTRAGDAVRDEMWQANALVR